jgi:dipeptide/tripeptide permease
MRMPAYIALIASLGAFIAVVAASTLMPAPSWHIALGATPLGILNGLFLAVLVGIGTYFGVRWAAPYQRTARLAKALGFIYLTVGIVISLPRRTHAVLMTMPRADDSSVDLLGPLLTYLTPVILVAFALILARALAQLCAPKGKS